MAGGRCRGRHARVRRFVGVLRRCRGTVARCLREVWCLLVRRHVRRLSARCVGRGDKITRTILERRVRIVRRMMRRGRQRIQHMGRHIFRHRLNGFTVDVVELGRAAVRCPGGR